MKKTLLSVVACLLFGAVYAQTTILTNHDNNNGNSSVTFNVYNSNPYDIVVTDLLCHLTGSANNNCQLLVNTTPINTPFPWSKGTIGNGFNGWTSRGTAVVPADESNGVVTAIAGLQIVSPAGVTYGFAFSSSGLRYSTLNQGSVNTFTVGGVSILTGDNISYGGAVYPSTPVNYPRGFIGGITFVPATPCVAPPAMVSISANRTCTTMPTRLWVPYAGESAAYAWESSVDGTTFSPIVSGVSNLRAYNASVTQDTYFRCVITCAGQSITTAPYKVIVPKSNHMVRSICNGTSFTLNGIDYYDSGSYTQVRPAANGCDSTITLDLTVRDAITGSLDTVICEGEAVTIGGISYTAAGTYTRVLTSAAGCDSTLTLHLSVKPVSDTVFTETVCSSYTLNGQTYTASGTYTQLYTNYLGCDSTLTLHLTVNRPTGFTLTQTACSSYTLNDSIYTASGTYVQHFINSKNCDSTLTLHLTINRPTAEMLTHTACDSYTLNGTTYNTSGTYTQVRPNAAGCDSTITLNLTVNYSSVSSLTHTACDSYTLNGTTYNTSGTYTQVRPNAAGCDSTITLNLTVNRSTAHTVTHTACETYTWYGTAYTASGQYTHTLTNAAGCDSLLTLDLTINQPTAATLTETACGSFALNGQSYTQSGTYTQTLTNAAGCDSVLTLDLTINQPTAATLTEAACGSFALNGQSYTQSGTYTQTLTNAAGCDSILTLNLTVNPITSSTLNRISCTVFTLNGQTYTQTGTYTQNLTSAAGCDSTVTLHLTIEPLTAPVTQDGATLQCNNIQTGTTYQWIDCATGTNIPGATERTFTAPANGSYRVAVANGGCTATSVCFTVSTVGIKESETVEVSVFPNPNDGRFQIRLGATYPDIRVELYDMAGRAVLQRRAFHTNTVDIDEVLGSGVYQIRIYAGNAVMTKTIIRR